MNRGCRVKVATKFVSALCPDQQHQLEHLAAHDPTRRVRRRAHSLLLSARGSSIDEIAHIYQVHRNTVSSWIDHWEQEGVNGLPDKPRSGGPSKLTASEKEAAQALLQTYPNAPNPVLAVLNETTGKTISRSTLKRIAKGAGLRWKRMRKSIKHKRNEQAFTQAQKEIEALKKTSIRPT